MEAMKRHMRYWTKEDFSEEFAAIKRELRDANFYICDTQRKRKIDQLMLRWGATMSYLRGLL